MTDRKSSPAPRGAFACQWCQGTGFAARPAAYVSGIDPFAGPAETVRRAGQCRHCRGTGVYDSAMDPTLDHPE
ncbi:hypothetical protein ACWD4B_18400 [Streptomyces sp. NPDC002536]